ncbi:Uncharacterised protein [Chlamydia trachomatis]|nr:Uncharacterised protein [Chlamydia trachomatis]
MNEGWLDDLEYLEGRLTAYADSIRHGLNELRAAMEYDDPVSKSMFDDLSDQEENVYRTMLQITLLAASYNKKFKEEH